VRFDAIGTRGAALFQGRFLLSGTYFYGYATADSASLTADGFRLHFVPDPGVGVLLPHWEDQRRVAALEFENPEVFIQTVIRPAVLRSLYDGRIPSVSGRVSMLVESYSALMERERAAYSVRFLALTTLESPATKRELVEELGD
jgi:hypothetical protein